MVQKIKNIEILLEQKELELSTQHYLSFSSEDLLLLDENSVDTVKDRFHGRAMMLLPQTEITFFEWLKKNDRAVWDDLWKEEEESYLVSIDFLHHFVGHGNGFPICDLIDENNYWFCSRHIKPKAMERMEEIRKKAENKGKLSFEEGLLIEIARGSIDLWHFCYKYNLPLDIAKEKIDALHSEDLLVHLNDREDLVKYLDV